MTRSARSNAVSRAPWHVDAVLASASARPARASAACRRPGRRHSGTTYGTRADVIFVAVRQHERRDAPFLLQVGQIRNDQIDAEQFGIGKHDAGVDDDRRVAPGERQHVHAELAETAERNNFEHQQRKAHTRTEPVRADAGRRREPRRGSIRLLGAPEVKRGWDKAADLRTI